MRLRHIEVFAAGEHDGVENFYVAKAHGFRTCSMSFGGRTNVPLGCEPGRPWTDSKDARNRPDAQSLHPPIARPRAQTPAPPAVMSATLNRSAAMKSRSAKRSLSS